MSFAALGWLSTTQARTSSSRSASLTAITAACCTSGWVSSTASTSAAAMFSPERRMMFFLRSTKCSMPSASRTTTSPVWNQPPRQASSVAACVVEVSREAAAARRRRGMAEQHLARLPVGEVALLVVDHAHFHPGDFPPEGARADLARLVAVRQAAHHLGHAPEFDQGKAEALLDRPMELRLDAGADAEAHACALSCASVGWLCSMAAMMPR